MASGKTVTMEMVRKAARVFCQAGETVSHMQLYDALGLISEPEKARLRTRVNGMVNQGEMNREAPGLYTYNFKFKLREHPNHRRLWTWIRAETTPWSYAKLCQLTGIGYSQVARYCNFLEEQKLIMRRGKRKNVLFFVKTAKAENTPETPYRSNYDKSPFEQEEEAAAIIAQRVLCHDLYAVKTKREIVAACKVLLARFDETFKQNENGEHHD